MNLCSNRPQIKTVKDFVGINQRNWYNWYMCFDCRFKTTRFEITDTITTQVHYLEPIYYEEYKDMKSKEIAELVKQRIQDKISSI